MKKIVFLYHKDCLDGFGAAWAAWRKYKDIASYVPVEHSAPPPEGLVNKQLYLLDFCYCGEIMTKLAAENETLTIIDHHSSARETIEHFPSHHYSETHSGAVLTWKYFKPKRPVPRLLLHIEDNDLWKFTVPQTEPIIAALETYPYSFTQWDVIARDLEDRLERRKYVQEGKAVIRYQNKFIDRMEATAVPVVFEGVEALAVNASMLASKIGNRILEHGRTPLAIVWSVRRNKVYISLRGDGSVDVGAIADSYGGGGHKNAAGFAVPSVADIPWTQNTIQGNKTKPGEPKKAA